MRSSFDIYNMMVICRVIHDIGTKGNGYDVWLTAIQDSLGASFC